MAIILFDPQWVIARLGDQVMALEAVGGAADLAAAAQNGPRQLPAAFVMDLATAPAPNPDGTAGISQHTIFRFGIVLAVQNVRDSRGEAAQTDLRTMRIAVMEALHGWSPAQDFDPIELGPGRLLEFRDLTIWWQDDFVTRNLLRSF